MERRLRLPQVEVLGETLLDALVEAVGATREEHHGDDDDGQHHKEAHSQIHISGYDGTHGKQRHKVAQYQ